MIRSLDPSSESFLRDLHRVNQRAETAQRRLGSGKKIESSSDSPDRISNLLSARSKIEETEQTRLNLVRLSAETDTAEQSLGRAVKLLERAIVLASQGASTTSTASSRAAAAEEVAGILEQLVNITQVRVEDRHIFGGDADQQVPYTYDPTQVTPVSAYAGADSTRLAQHPSGAQFAMSRTAEQIFDSSGAGENVFQAVDALRTALEGNLQPEAAAALDGLRTAHSYVNRHLAFYGSVQNRLQDATEFANRKELLLRAQVSEMEDADPAAEIMELKQASTQLEAALMSRAQMPRRSLFDYLG